LERDNLSDRKLTSEEFFKMFPEIQTLIGEDRMDERMALRNILKSAVLVESYQGLPPAYHRAGTGHINIEGTGRDMYLANSEGKLLAKAKPYDETNRCSVYGLCSVSGGVEEIIARLATRPAFAVAIEYKYVSNFTSGRPNKKVESEATVYKLACQKS
jgi:hypothetical protein